jgi:stringent starvation protein B
MVMVHLDARRRGVRVPQAHAENPALALNLSYRFGIPDLEIDESGVSASLSFGGNRFHCVMPWRAVFAMRSHTDDTFHVWSADIPDELLVRAQEYARQISDHALGEAAELARGKNKEEEDTPEEELPEVGRPTSVPYLRVVK